MTYISALTTQQLRLLSAWQNAHCAKQFDRWFLLFDQWEWKVVSSVYASFYQQENYLPFFIVQIQNMHHIKEWFNTKSGEKSTAAMSCCLKVQGCCTSENKFLQLGPVWSDPQPIRMWCRTSYFTVVMSCRIACNTIIITLRCTFRWTHMLTWRCTCCQYEGECRQCFYCVATLERTTSLLLFFM